MAVHERRLTGRDVLAKTFQARTKRGYDPIEVDAYLELIAAQIDMLHGDIMRASEDGGSPAGGASENTDRLDELAAELDAISAERDAFRAERDALEQSNTELDDARARLEAENEQLRAQVTATAPPPPPSDAPATDAPAQGAATDAPAQGATSDAVAISEVIDIEATSGAPDAMAATGAGDERAVEESYELMLRMARRSAEETIAEAHNRADEIIADANFTAAQISRESDRKAFEAANKVQAELASMNEEIDLRKSELDRLASLSERRREAMRELASQLLVIAEDDERALMAAESDPVLDIRPSTDSDTTV